MKPLSLNAGQKVIDRLLTADALQDAILAAARSEGVTLPPIRSTQVVMSSAPLEMADENLQLSYPRVCISASTAQNIQLEKFRSFSGVILVAVEVLASGDLLGAVEQWIHFYAEGVCCVLRNNVGDWGDGFFFGGSYDAQFQSPKRGGFGYLQSVKVTCKLNVSLA